MSDIEHLVAPNEITQNKRVSAVDSPCYLFVETEKKDIYYLAQAFIREERNIAFYAIKLRFLGDLTYVRNKKETFYLIKNAINNEKFESWANTFQVTVNTVNKTVRFGPVGNIFIKKTEHRNLGLGSYAMTQLIKWLKKDYGDYQVLAGSLSDVDASEVNSPIRHNFYVNLGFKVKYEDDNGNGRFYADSVNDLIFKDNLKVSPLSIDEFLERYFISRIEEQKTQKRNLEILNRKDRLVNEVIPEKNKLIYRYKSAFFLLVTVLLLILGIYGYWFTS